MPELATVAITLGSIPLFASRSFSTALWLVLFARLQAAGTLPFGTTLGALRFEAALEFPAWLISEQALFVLLLLALAETWADKNPDVRLLLTELDPLFKAAGNFLFHSTTLVGSITLAAAAGYHAAGIGGLTWAAVPAAGVWLIARLRRSVLAVLTELDEDDDIGLRRLISWAEDGWVGGAAFLLVVMPLVALTVAGLTVAALGAVQLALRVWEKRRKEPCSHCAAPMLLSAPACPFCRTAAVRPMAVGAFGQPTSTPVTDLVTHQLRLLSKRRCLVCATRLPKKRLRQTCIACGSEVLPSTAWADRYLAFVERQLPKTLLVCGACSLVPVLGLIPGIIYYRLSLISSLRTYVPPATGCLTRWAVRIANLLLLAFQWVPFFGAFTLPGMCYLNYAIYRRVLLGQKQAFFGSDATR